MQMTILAVLMLLHLLLMMISVVLMLLHLLLMMILVVLMLLKMLLMMIMIVMIIMIIIYLYDRIQPYDIRKLSKKSKIFSSHKNKNYKLIQTKI